MFLPPSPSFELFKTTLNSHAYSHAIDAKLSKFHYSSQGHWKDIAAIKKLSEVAKEWLIKQALWQIYLPTPRHISWPCPHPTQYTKQTFFFCLKTNRQVGAKSFSKKPKPQLLQVHPGREFLGSVTKETENHKKVIGRGRVDIHRDQVIVERFNRTRAERLFGHQYTVPLKGDSSGPATSRVARLPKVVAALNNGVKSLTHKKPAVSIKEKTVAATRPSTKYSRPVGQMEKKLPSFVNVRYLFQLGE